MICIQEYPSLVALPIVKRKQSVEDMLCCGSAVQSRYNVDFHPRQSKESKVLLRSIGIIARDNEQPIVSKAVWVFVPGGNGARLSIK
jgi:hypothetical protein